MSEKVCVCVCLSIRMDCSHMLTTQSLSLSKMTIATVLYLIVTTILASHFTFSHLSDKK